MMLVCPHQGFQASPAFISTALGVRGGGRRLGVRGLYTLQSEQLHAWCATMLLHAQPPGAHGDNLATLKHLAARQGQLWCLPINQAPMSWSRC